MTERNIKLFSSCGLLLAACIWGFAFVIVKDSLNYVNAIYMMAFRFSIASVVLGIVFIKKLLALKRRDVINGAVLGFFLFAAYVTQTIGCDYTTAGKNAFLTTVYVLLVPILSWPLYHKRPAWHVFVASVMSVVGIGLLALNRESGSLVAVNRGDILTLVCGVFYALHILYMKKCNEENGDPILLTVLQFFAVALFSWSGTIFFGGAFPAGAVRNPQIVLSMLYLGLLSTLLCYVLQNVGLKYLPSPLTSLLMSFESVFGVLFSTIFLHEVFTVRMCVGCALIFFAVVLAECVPSQLKR